MREIVAAKIGSTITNDKAIVAQALDDGKSVEFLDLQHMRLMSSCDVGRNWDLLAQGKVWFRLACDGTVHAPKTEHVT
jgi:hypothetical protein